MDRWNWFVLCFFFFFNGKPRYLMVRNMVSCGFSFETIQRREEWKNGCWWWLVMIDDGSWFFFLKHDVSCYRRFIMFHKLLVHILLHPKNIKKCRCIVGFLSILRARELNHHPTQGSNGHGRRSSTPRPPMPRLWCRPKRQRNQRSLGTSSSAVGNDCGDETISGFLGESRTNKYDLTNYRKMS